jgi:hypothetical protein
MNARRLAPGLGALLRADHAESEPAAPYARITPAIGWQRPLVA